MFFGGKSGLLFNIVNLHVTEGHATTIETAPVSKPCWQNQKLMDWQIDHLWKEREFLSVVFSCAILQPRLGKRSAKVRLPARDRAHC